MLAFPLASAHSPVVGEWSSLWDTAQKVMSSNPGIDKLPLSISDPALWPQLPSKLGHPVQKDIHCICDNRDAILFSAVRLGNSALSVVIPRHCCSSPECSPDIISLPLTWYWLHVLQVKSSFRWVYTYQLTHLYSLQGLNFSPVHFWSFLVCYSIPGSALPLVLLFLDTWLLPDFWVRFSWVCLLYIQ